MQADLKTVTDRRRAGRQDISPELIPILRGKFNADAPVDPDIPLPRHRTADQELLSGVVIIVGLVIVGVILRFAV